jgi:hypothetical protein
VERNPFANSRLRLEWAKEDLADFEWSAESYLNRKPYRFAIDPDPDGIHERHKLKLSEPLPSALTKHTVHALEDLRSALDLATFAVALLADAPLDNVHFPFSGTGADMKSRLNSACKDFPEEIKGLFASYQPHSGGSELLYAIKELGNASKYQLIVPVAHGIGTTMPYFETTGGTRPLRIFEGLSNLETFTNSEEGEITFAITERGLNWKYEADFTFSICFGKIGAIEGRNVRDNIAGMIEAVTLIIDETESEMRRLGLLCT